MNLTAAQELHFRTRGLPVEDEPTLWQGGPVTWRGRLSVRPLAPDVGYGTNMVMPERVAFEFRGEGGAPTLEALIEVRHGVPELAQISMSATAAGGLRTSELRNVLVDGLVLGVAEMTAEAVTQVQPGVFEHSDPPPGDGHRTAARARRGSSPTGSRTGRPRTPQERIQYAADVYRDHLQSNPRQAVMDRMEITGSTADRYIARARASGLLPATTRGRARG